MDKLEDSRSPGQEMSFDMETVWDKGPLTETSLDSSSISSSVDNDRQEMYTHFTIQVRFL